MSDTQDDIIGIIRKAGGDAHAGGLKRRVNPFRETTRRKAWFDGWDEADRKKVDPTIATDGDAGAALVKRTEPS